MPFRHVAMFRWSGHVDASHVDRVRDAFDELAVVVRGLRHHAHGADVGMSEGTFDYLVVADFDSVADWRTYRDHPLHVLLVEELVNGHVVDQVAGQFVVPGDRSAHDLSAQRMQALLAEPDDATTGDAETDDELLARARRAATADMQALLAEPDDITTGDAETDDELLARARRAATADIQALLAEPDDITTGDAETDDELLARARRAATADIQALLAEPDDIR